MPFSRTSATGADPWNSRDGFRALAGHPAASCRVVSGLLRRSVGDVTPGLQLLECRVTGLQMRRLVTYEPNIQVTTARVSFPFIRLGILFRKGQPKLLAGRGPGLESEAV